VELPNGSITVKDLFLELKGLREDLTRVLVHMESVDTRNAAADKAHADFEARIRVLERFRYTLAGLAVVGGSVAGYVGYVLGHYVH
jgi:hypothetical protein